MPTGQTSDSRRLFADGHFSTPDGKARLIPTVPQAPVLEREEGWLLNTGRLRDQWHTMTRTGHLPRLMEAEPYPRVTVNHHTLLQSGLEAGQLVHLSSPRGEVLARLERDDALADNEAFMPIRITSYNVCYTKLLRAPHPGQIAAGYGD